MHATVRIPVRSLSVGLMWEGVLAPNLGHSTTVDLTSSEPISFYGQECPRRRPQSRPECVCVNRKRTQLVTENEPTPG